MTLYAVSRPGAWLSEEELAATMECGPAVAAQFAEHVRWVRSYVMRDADGTFSGHCYYEATSPEWIEKFSEAAMLPVGSIKPVLAAFAA